MQLRKDGVTWREIDGEMVLLDLKTSKYLTTNRAGTTLVKLLAEDRTADDLTSALVTEFGISADRAAGDVAAFVGSLEQRGLLQVAAR
ncbi:PqqD family protein [Occultella glacieicola]|uniref:PqqD family protein n=1 Tax=Occultella glacieicola TaxID=2518684 RepID=A0ABY2E362_9MICO|nr:PqqD family protein [Occultella glacieicola]TDE94061.1 PqqD family protein [Occultella glacieicola]